MGVCRQAWQAGQAQELTPVVLPAVLVEVLVEGPVLPQAVGGAVVALLGVHLRGREMN